jgi:ubiquinone/menaquinone biosynthesis C-methylase UbiE
MSKKSYLLRAVKEILDRDLKINTDKFFWKFRHVFDHNWPDSYISKESLNYPYRKLLAGKMASYYPFENVLEIGCASGPNLVLLAKEYPKADFYGIDISRKAIDGGKVFLKKNNIENVFLKQGDAENLTGFSDKSMDIVFTDAVLIYINKDRIGPLIKEMARVAKKALVFLEWHTEGNSYYNGHWIHNYETLLKEQLPKIEIKKTKISEAVWPGDWAKYGYIIEVVLNKNNS